MITVIIGQRGVGKTQLLKRIHRYTESAKTPCFDLDQEIERRSKKSVRAIFENEGEEAFREIEKRVFHEIILAHSSCYLAVGAGFPVGMIPSHAKVLWVQRATDHAGRVFLDRPRLEADLPPLEEYEKRARTREFHFRNVYDQIYFMPEGLTEVDSLEEEIVIKHKKVVAGSVTLLPELFVKESRWHSFIERYANHGVEFFEVRDDLLNHDQIQTCLGSLFTEKFIFSFRTGQSATYPQGSQVLYYDWALELGEMPQPVRFLKQRLIISLHDLKEGESLENAIQRLNDETGKCVHLKLATMVKTFDDLLLGYLWQQADPQNRSFLPRSESGRWAWFRLWMKGRQLLNFWRDADGSAKDQPVLYEWLGVHFIKTHFAAVLGKPVLQSWTPIEQKSFFEERNEPVFRIEIDQLEWEEALRALTVIGLRQAAVTSPLKEEAYHSSQQKSEEAELLHAVNTLYYDQERKQWRGHNTDLAGFKDQTQEIDSGRCIVLWGGGGTLNMMKKVLPQSFCFSATRGEIREEDQTRWKKELKPDVLVWAAPRKGDMKWPDPDWKPSLVIDLNYTEDSAGREYAQRIHAEYRSGVRMFQTQAQHQRDFWENQT
ncbi:shikimate kinase [Bdellovibrio sp. HCB337]|uniref:shikimate kinase n=1 Tax=Bdellovibrio sp. HCB337 TaxID=3394358 RepID=UPI0039A6D763